MKMTMVHPSCGAIFNQHKGMDRCPGCGGTAGIEEFDAHEVPEPTVVVAVKDSEPKQHEEPTEEQKTLFQQMKERFGLS